MALRERLSSVSCPGPCEVLVAFRNRVAYEQERADQAEAELERVMNERDLAVLTLAAFTPADQPLPTIPTEGDA